MRQAQVFFKIAEDIDRSEDAAVQNIVRASEYICKAVSILHRCTNDLSRTNKPGAEATTYVIDGLQSDILFLEKLIEILNGEV